jgi:hypothetical protein
MKNCDMTDIGTLAASVETATRAYEGCKRAESVARGETCTALNALNEAQRRLDAKLAEMRKAAPSDSDWSRKTGVPLKA